MMDPRRWRVPLAALLLAMAFGVWAQSTRIEKIVLKGSDRLTQDGFLALTSLRAGDTYDEARVKSEYAKIWKTGLFEDLTVDSEPGEAGVVLTFTVKEKPIIGSVEFKGSKKLTSSTVLDKLKENNADVKTGSVLDYNKVKKTEAALGFMASEKGFPDAQIRSKVQNMGRSQVALTFEIEEGPKSSIDKVKFTGNKAFSTTRLRYTMKKTRSHWMGSWATQHDVYAEGRFFEDVKELRQLYESKGYLDVEIGEPVVDARVSGSGKRKWLNLTIPIEEGISYTLGEVDFEGNTLFPKEELGKIFSQRKGKVLDKTLLGFQMKAIESKYGQQGYIYATATPIFNKNKDTRTADVTVSITEEKKYFVNRIDFSGNTQTRDYVLRREMQIYEQEVFDYARYQRGLYRLKQGGIFEIKDDPVITKVPETDKVNVEVKGTEASKNEFLFGGGYGGVNGFFIQGSFRTYNFLGMGTTLALNADVGNVQTIYSVSYTDPWLFGRRIGATTNIFDNKVKYLQFDQKSRGGSFAVTFPLGDFAGWQVGYRFERSKATDFSNSFYMPTVYLDYLNSSSTSAVFGGIMYNSVNNPFRPVNGLSANLSVTYAGTFLGGDNYFVKPSFDATYYLPTWPKQNLAFRVSTAYIKPMQGREIPIWERFFLGGEDTLRGFGVRSVYPLTKDGRFFVDPDTRTIEGGDRTFLANIEYVFHIIQQVDLALFIDVGNTYHERQRLDLSNYRGDAGLEMRFFVPMFNVPLRLIYATNLNSRPHDDFSNFQFSIGLTF